MVKFQTQEFKNKDKKILISLFISTPYGLFNAEI